MAEPKPFVPAYDKRTGKKLPQLVPRHFVEELAHITNLSATPRGKKGEPSAAAPSSTPATPVAESTDTEKD